MTVKELLHLLEACTPTDYVYWQDGSPVDWLTFQPATMLKEEGVYLHADSDS